MASNEKTAYRKVSITIDGKEIQASVNKIEAEMKKVRKAMKNAEIGSEEYNKQMRRLAELKGVLREHQREMQRTLGNTSYFKRITQGVNRYMVSVTTAFNAVGNLMARMEKFRALNREQQEAAANVKSLTGLDDESIQWLEQQAEELSTHMDSAGLRIRASAAEIMKAYMLVGSNKPDLLKDKEALNAVTVETMRLAEAAKMDLTEAVTAVTTAMNQFGASSDEAARYVNVLAAGSQRGSANVQEQAEAILKTGVAAKTAGLSFEELDGAIEMLGEMGIKGQMAGTYLNAFLMKLATGSRAGKLQTEGLAAVLQDLNDEFQRNEQLQAGKGMELFSKEFSDRGTRAALVLSQNIGKMQEYTAAVTGVATAYEQAAINSDTNAARMAQMRNEMNLAGQALAKELEPLFLRATSAMNGMTKAGLGIVRFLAQHKSTIAATSAAITVYVAWMKRAVVADALKDFWNKRLVTSTKALTAAMKANPWGAVIAVATSLAVAVVDLVKNMDRLTEAEREQVNVAKQAAADYSDEESKIRRLNKVVHDNSVAIDARRTALRELKDIVHDYKADLTDEGELINDNTLAIENYLVARRKQITLQAQEDKIREYERERAELLVQQTQNKQELEDAEAEANAWIYPGMDNDAFLVAWRKVRKAERKLKRTEKELAEKDATLAVLDEVWNAEYTKQAAGTTTTGSPSSGNKGGVCPVCGNDPCTCEQHAITSEERIRAVEERYSKLRLELKKSYYESDKTTREEYEQQLLQLELQELDAKLKVAGLEPQKRIAIEEKYVELSMKMRSQAAEQSSKRTLDEQQKHYQEEVRQLTEEHYKNLTSEEEYQAQLRQLALDYHDRVLEDTVVSEQDKAGIREKMQQLQLDVLKEGYQKEMDERKKAEEEREEADKKEVEAFRQKGEAMKEIAQDMGQQVGELFQDLFEGEEDAFRDFFRNALVILLDSLEKQLVAIQAAAIAEVTIKDITSKGLAGLATAAAKIALITTAFETGKAALKADWGSAEAGYAYGGYTTPGPWYQPAGTVHAGEFVANHWAVQNTAVRPVLDVIDRAQRTGMAETLTSSDMIAAAQSGTPAGKDVNAEFIALMARLEHTTEKAARAYLRPSAAYCFVEGTGGIRQAQELSDRIRRNAHRPIGD